MLEFLRRLDGSSKTTGVRSAGPIEVVDGDGIKREGVLYRLAGFDAPELETTSAVERERGIRAFLRLKELVGHASEVRLEPVEKRENSSARWSG